MSDLDPSSLDVDHCRNGLENQPSFIPQRHVRMGPPPDEALRRQSTNDTPNSSVVVDLLTGPVVLQHGTHPSSVEYDRGGVLSLSRRSHHAGEDCTDASPGSSGEKSDQRFSLKRKMGENRRGRGVPINFNKISSSRFPILQQRYCCNCNTSDEEFSENPPPRITPPTTPSTPTSSPSSILGGRQEGAQGYDEYDSSDQLIDGAPHSFSTLPQNPTRLLWRILNGLLGSRIIENGRNNEYHRYPQLQSEYSTIEMRGEESRRRAEACVAACIPISDNADLFDAKAIEEDISTIDWNRDRAVYLAQQQTASDRFPSGGIGAIFLKGEGWLFVAIIAMLTGLAAAWIEICVKYLSDLRIGVCRGMLWQDRSFCCGSRAAVDFDNNSCFVNESPIVHMDQVDHAKWLSWSQVLHVHNNFSAYIIDYVVYMAIAIALAILAAWLCHKFAPMAAGSGIPEVKTILGGFVMKGVLGGWTAVIKCVGLSLGVASGLALGKEGPLVHIACCFANLVGRLSIKYSDNEGKKRELLSAASAAGVSVAFGAPLGGVLFSLEEVSSYFPPKTLWKSFFGAVIGALTLKSLDSSGSGRLTLFQMDSVSLLGSWQLVELIPFALIGLMGGTIGSLFIRLNVHWMENKKKYPSIALHPIFEVAVVTAICSFLNYPVAMLRVPSATLLEQMFGRCGVNPDPDIFSLCSSRSDPEHIYSDYSLKWEVLAELTFAAVIKFIQACFTFGMGLPAGLFIPSLTIGALCGRLTGLLTVKLNAVLGFVDCHKCIHPGVYAIVGAAAMLGGVTRVTISIVVIMFELTGGLSYVVPFMVSVMIAKWVGDVLCEYSIYDCFIRLKGYPYLHNDDTHTFTAKAKDIMDTKLVVITLEGNTVTSLQQKLLRYPFSGFPLVNARSDRLLIGFVSASELRRALEIAMASDRRVTGNTKVLFSTDGATSSHFGHIRRMTFRKLMDITSGGIASHHYMSGGEKCEGLVLNFAKLVDAQTIQLVPETPLGQIHNIFRQLGLRFCLLTHRGRLEGLLTKRKFLAHVEHIHAQQSN